MRNTIRRRFINHNQKKTTKPVETAVQHLAFWKSIMDDSLYPSDQILYPSVSIDTRAIYRKSRLFATRFDQFDNSEDFIEDDIISNTIEELGDITGSNNQRNGIYRSNVVLWSGGSYTGDLVNFGEVPRVIQPYGNAIEKFTLIAARGLRISSSGGTGDNNHCLYKALCQYKSFLEKEFTPVEFKKWLKVKASDKINVNKIDKIERKFKICIHITGDVIKPSTKNYTTSITLSLLNNHYSYVSTFHKSTGEIVHNPKYWIQFGSTYYQSVKAKKTREIKFKEDYPDNDKFYEDSKLFAMFSLKELKMSKPEFYEFQKEMLYKYHVDITKVSKLNQLVLYLFGQNCRGMMPQEPIDFDEQCLISAIPGGLKKSYQPGTWENMIDLDINSCFAWVLNTKTFPAKSGVWHTLTTLPKYPKYGYYYINDLGKKRIATHIELKYNQDLKLVLNETNAYIYESTFRGSLVFGDYIKLGLDLKNNPKTKGFGKVVLSTIIGRLRSRNIDHIQHSLNSDKDLILPDSSEWLGFDMWNNNKIQFNMHDPKKPLYKYDWARITPFVYDFARFRLRELMDIAQDIFYVNTDGLITTRLVYLDMLKEHPELFGKNLGQLKVQNSGTVHIKKTVKATWI